MAGGSGRGNKGVEVVQDPSRPDCHRCGGWMKSNGKDWRCTSCGRNYRKIDRRPESSAMLRDLMANEHGFDAAHASWWASECHQAEVLIVTSAQNNTAAQPAFIAALENCAEYYGAKIAVIPCDMQTFELFGKDRPEKAWDSRIAKYLVKGDIEIGNVTIRSDVRIRPTTVNPLSGKHGHCGNRWVVFGHPQHMMEPVPSPANLLPKRMYTTGSVTPPNYTISDAGEKARFHHVMGALIIENMGEHCFIRMINADKNGSFYDLDKRFTAKGVTEGHRIEVLTTGDEHVKFNAVSGPTYLDKGSIAKTLRPKYIVRHDVLDGYAGSHHHEHDDVTQFRKWHLGDNDYRAELDQCVAFINKTTPGFARTLIVPSNHHDHLDKWLSRVDPRRDPVNALLIHDLKKAQYENALTDNRKGAFQLYAEPLLRVKCSFLERNQPCIIGGVDHSQHGDIGANGSRGGAKTMAKSTYKMTIGHSHGARLYQGVLQVGTSTGPLEYEKGLSDHSTTHAIQYKNGKRTHIDIINGKWRK